MRRSFSSTFAVVLFAGLLLAFAAPAALSAQSQLAVELGHPVYAVLSIAELRGVISRLSAAKPYTRAQVADYLAAIQSNMDKFSPAERSEIEVLAREFAPGKFGGDTLLKLEGGKAVLGARVSAEARLDLGRVGDLILGQGSSALTNYWNLTSVLDGYIAGAPAPWISLRGNAGFTLDKVQKGLYLPYEFTKAWDGIHSDLSPTRHSEGDKDYPSLALEFGQDIAAGTESGDLTLRFSRYRREWGLGLGSLSLSGTARPFVGLETSYRPSSYFALSSLVGSLYYWMGSYSDRSTTQDSSGNYSDITYQKMFALQRIEVFPWDWLSLGMSSSMVGAKRFELGYFAPLVSSVIYQSSASDLENVGLQVDGAFLVPGLGKLYASFFADEMEITHLDYLFTKARNMFALQGGLKVPLPWLSFLTFSAQYTKIEPYVYAHYPTWYPDYRMRVDESYTNDGENLGYHLPPNSDEFLGRLECAPALGMRAFLQYSFVRHGVSPGKGNTVDDYLVYIPDLYSITKDFLHDGVYQYNHIGKIGLSWRPEKGLRLAGVVVPAELGIGYGLSYSWYIDGTGGTGASAYSPGWVSALELSAKFSL